MRIKASVVLWFLDDFTSKSVSMQDITCYIKGEKRPLLKKGFVLFLNLSVGKYEIIVESNVYQKKSIMVKMEEGYSEPVLKKVRLSPSEGYQKPEQATVLYGKAVKDMVLTFYGEKLTEEYRLLKDFRFQDFLNKPYIEIHHNKALDFSGKKFMIYGEKVSEFFEASWQDEENKNRYYLKEPLTNDYSKIGTKIFPVYETTIKADMKYFIMIGSSSADSMEIICSVEQDQKRQERKIEIKGRERNKINF